MVDTVKKNYKTKSGFNHKIFKIPIVFSSNFF